MARGADEEEEEEGAHVLGVLGRCGVGRCGGCGGCCVVEGEGDYLMFFCVMESGGSGGRRCGYEKTGVHMRRELGFCWIMVGRER